METPPYIHFLDFGKCGTECQEEAQKSASFQLNNPNFCEFLQKKLAPL